MRKYIPILIALLAVHSCTKYEKGFLSPNVQYLQSNYLVAKGRVFTSQALNPDGSSMPMNIQLLHVHDADGNLVDSLFFKKYPVTIWTAIYNPLTDTTVSEIQAKQDVQQLPAIAINANSGVIQGNSATANLPAGTYTFDERISNVAGSLTFSNIVSITLADTPYFDWAPALGTVYDHLFMVGNESVTAVAANPVVTVARTADTPNVVVLKMVDKNGVPFNPANGEIVRRPNSGLNPVPPYLPCLEDYTATYAYTDTSMRFSYGVTPFPFTPYIAADGYNLYYRIPTQFFSVAGFPDGKYSANPRVPFRLYYIGAYSITVQFPDMTHK